ncbi:MAG: helix-turn-helix domain-containing protein [Acidimicrobiales bacterium]
MAEPRKRRANGEASRQRILDAAAAIAGERGYEGTSINLVSERSGLPASSIYWHFKDKDALIAAVIQRSFEEWLRRVSAWEPTAADASREERMSSMMERTASTLAESGDFLRLGLMLSLERRPDEPSARRMFIQTREETIRRTVGAYARQFPELDDEAIHQLATFTMAMADGLFVAQEIGGDSVDILGQFETLAAALIGAADHLATRPRRRSRTASR